MALMLNRVMIEPFVAVSLSLFIIELKSSTVEPHLDATVVETAITCQHMYGNILNQSHTIDSDMLPGCWLVPSPFQHVMFLVILIFSSISAYLLLTQSL